LNKNTDYIIILYTMKKDLITETCDIMLEMEKHNNSITQIATYKRKSEINKKSEINTNKENKNNEKRKVCKKQKKS